MRISFLRFFLVLGAAATLARAQVPAVSQPVPAQTFSPGADAVTIDLRNHFAVAGVAGPLVQFDTVFGRFNVELLPNAAPRHVENFLNYVSASRYSNSFIHRTAPFEGSAISIVQGGGYTTVGGGQVDTIAKFPAVPLEYNLPNARGTLAAARTTDVNSATSEWFFNTRDNSTILGPGNGGGYSVFGRVIGTGMTIVDQIAALQRVNAGAPFNELPVRNYSGGNIGPEHLVIVNAVRAANLFPTGGGTSVVAFTVQNSATNVVQATLSGSSLTLSPVAPGSALITLRAADTNGNGAETTISVTVQGLAPVFVAQPVSFTAAAGTTVVLRSAATHAASYRWERNGVEVQGANRGTLVLNNISAADAGAYRSIATNSLGSVTSQPATVGVVNVPSTGIGRLINLSIMSNASAGAGVLTVGAVVGPLDSSGTVPLLFRAVGPTLSTDFGVPGALADPVMSLFAAGVASPLATNDDWSAGDASAFTSVGAFALRANSADSAIWRANGERAGGYTVQVVGKGGASGLALAEIYEAATARTASTPRLINVSVQKILEPAAILVAGFVIRGDSARTVLIRGIGPGLRVFPGITDAMTDPKLALYDAATVRIAENDNWGGDLQINDAGARVGAFPITDPNSRDAMLLITLPPGDYTAQVAGVADEGGRVIVEIYEIP